MTVTSLQSLLEPFPAGLRQKLPDLCLLWDSRSIEVPELDPVCTNLYKRVSILPIDPKGLFILRHLVHNRPMKWNMCNVYCCHFVLIPCISETKLESVIYKGFTPFGLFALTGTTSSSTNEGYFRSGIYFTNSARDSAGIYIERPRLPYMVYRKPSSVEYNGQSPCCKHEEKETHKNSKEPIPSVNPDCPQSFLGSVRARFKTFLSCLASKTWDLFLDVFARVRKDVYSDIVNVFSGIVKGVIYIGCFALFVRCGWFGLHKLFSYCLNKINSILKKILLNSIPKVTEFRWVNVVRRSIDSIFSNYG